MRVPRAAVATALVAILMSCSVPAAFASHERGQSDSLAALAVRPRPVAQRRDLRAQPLQLSPLVLGESRYLRHR